MAGTREYTNGRIRVRPDQLECLENLLHNAWVELSRERARIKEILEQQGLGESGLVTEMNRELRLIASIQEEVTRTKEELAER